MKTTREYQSVPEKENEEELFVPPAYLNVN